MVGFISMVRRGPLGLPRREIIWREELEVTLLVVRDAPQNLLFVL